MDIWERLYEAAAKEYHPPDDLKPKSVPTHNSDNDRNDCLLHIFRNTKHQYYIPLTSPSNFQNDVFPELHNYKQKSPVATKLL